MRRPGVALATAILAGGARVLRNDEARYGAVAQVLHWLIAALVLVMFGLGWYMSGLPLGQRKFDMYQLHKSIGITILVLAAVRLLWRLVNPVPPLPPGIPPWERIAARLSHALLYLMLLVQPLIGFLQSNAANFPVVWWGVVRLPPLIKTDEALAETLVEAHAWNSRLLLALVLIHVGAALRHHFLLKDDVLRRMLPSAPSGSR
jgi:cytochrome b561